MEERNTDAGYVIGQIDSIKTTKDMCIRLTIDVDKDQAPPEIITWQNCGVVIKRVE